MEFVFVESFLASSGYAAVYCPKFQESYVGRRSSHLEEYTRSRPASAGSRPRSLLNKMANAAAAVQMEEDAEPADTEPWVLEGWGDGPSVVRRKGFARP